MRDPESCEMIEIIRRSRTIDPEMAYGFLGANNAFIAALNSGSTDALASTFEKNKKVANKNIEKLIKKIGE